MSALSFCVDRPTSPVGAAAGPADLQLSNEEAQGGESSSITNQRTIIQNYCRQNGITLVREFADDGWSGGNFDRPAFQEMMRQLEQGRANTVITKDLSRLGRDMREASYYAEQFFPEYGIRYIAIGDNFDTEHENIKGGCVNLKRGYNGNLTSRETGSVGGQTVKHMCPVRTTTFTRAARTAAGHQAVVQYISEVTV